MARLVCPRRHSCASHRISTACALGFGLDALSHLGRSTLESVGSAAV